MYINRANESAWKKEKKQYVTFLKKPNKRFAVSCLVLSKPSMSCFKKTGSPPWNLFPRSGSESSLRYLFNESATSNAVTLREEISFPFWTDLRILWIVCWFPFTLKMWAMPFIKRYNNKQTKKNQQKRKIFRRKNQY